MELTYKDYERFARMKLPQLENDSSFEAFHAKGPGGQGVNTADSAVRLTHIPTGIVVTSRESRSQFRNRQLCLKKLKVELIRRAIPPRARRITHPTHASVMRRLLNKKHRSELKKSRARVDMGD